VGDTEVMGALIDETRDSSGRQAGGRLTPSCRAADHKATLPPEDLEQLATSAFLIPKEPETTATWIRAFTRVPQPEPARAGRRCGMWLAHNLLLAGDRAKRSGWLARTQRLLADRHLDCSGHGYLLVVVSLLALGEVTPASPGYVTQIAVTA
jgi:hypothetical protein